MIQKIRTISSLLVFPNWTTWKVKSKWLRPIWNLNQSNLPYLIHLICPSTWDCSVQYTLREKWRIDVDLLISPHIGRYRMLLPIQGPSLWTDLAWKVAYGCRLFREATQPYTLHLAPVDIRCFFLSRLHFCVTLMPVWTTQSLLSIASYPSM